MGPTKYLILFIFSLQLMLAAQTGGIRGFVYDNKTGEPIIFGTVYIDGTTTGTTTDINGYYAISKIDTGKFEIAATYLGYNTKKESIHIKTDRVVNQNIYLTEIDVKLDAVVINATKKKAQTNVEVSSLKISADAIRKLPSIGGESDIAQYLQVVPGVVFSGEQGGQLYIRGGAPIQNKVLLDGMTIYNPFHSMGIFSVFETDIIKNTNVYTGGFNSEYGGRLSAVVDITTRDGNKKRMAGKISVNPFITKAIIEGPLVKMSPENETSISYILASKQSIIDGADQVLYKNFVDSLPYNFTDLYGKISINAKNGSKMNLFGFNFNDGIQFQQNDLSWNTLGYGLNYILIPGNSTTKIDGSFTYSKYGTDLLEEGLNTRSSDISGFNFNIGFTYYLANDEEFKYGFDVSGEQMEYYFLNPYNISMNLPNNTTDIGLFFKYKMKRGKSIIEPGLRIQRFGKLQANSLEPRLGYKLNINDGLRFKLAGGLYSQSLIAAVSDRDVVNLFSGFLFAPQEQLTDIMGNPSKHRLQKAWHLIAGLEKNLGEHISINTEGYYKLYTQLININRDKRDERESDFMIEQGDAYGIDFLIKYDKSFFSLWTTYSLSYVTRNDGNIVYFTNFDRRHNLNIVSSYTFGKDKNWEFGAKWNLGSGFPFTQIINYYPNNDFSGGINSDYLTDNPSVGIQYDQINGGRLPYFHRLDLNLKRMFYLGTDGNIKLETAFTITNAYNRQNIFYYDHLSNERENQLPLIPSIGANLTF